MTTSYSTHDPSQILSLCAGISTRSRRLCIPPNPKKGWCGDPRRGAVALGRPTVEDGPTVGRAHYLVMLDDDDCDDDEVLHEYEVERRERRLAEVTSRLEMLAKRARDVLAALDHARARDVLAEAEYRRRHPTWPLPGGAS